MSSINLTISPISKNLKSISSIDFKEQLTRTQKGELSWCWDDSRFNKAKPGEYFAFMFYGIRVIIHRITAVKPPSERLPSWSSNIGQTDRNVLELSHPLKEMTWHEWEQNMCPTAHMGTYTINTASDSWSELNTILMSLESQIETKVEEPNTKLDERINYIYSLENENDSLREEIKKLKEALHSVTNLYYSK